MFVFPVDKIRLFYNIWSWKTRQSTFLNYNHTRGHTLTKEKGFNYRSFKKYGQVDVLAAAFGKVLVKLQPERKVLTSGFMLFT